MVLFTLQVHENPLCVMSVTESRVRTRFGSSNYTQVLYHLQRGKCMESGRIRVLCKTGPILVTENFFYNQQLNSGFRYIP